MAIGRVELRYWWVNHKKTFAEETEGGFLWSPQVERSGARSQFYENMKVAQQGDVVLSYAGGKVQYVGSVEAPAMSASRPEIFGKKGEVWSEVGWLLPVNWSRLDQAIRPKVHLERISSLLPPKYSPLQPKTGNGNQKAYLCEISRELYEALIPSDAVPRSPAGSSNAFSTDALTSVVSRRGQQKFKDGLIEREGGCRVTGIQDPWLLIASHIKPWRHCETDEERLDPENGLLFPPHIDHLFDRGLMTIHQGKIKFPSELPVELIQKLGLTGVEKLDLGNFTVSQLSYLSFHNRFVFKGILD